MENECFGLPNGGMIVGIVFGVIIVLVGLGLFLQTFRDNFVFWPYFWPLIVIIFGVLILLGALFGRRRYSERAATTPTPA
jgi:uncharacterized membrane protein